MIASDADRLAELRREIADRIAQVQKIIGPERAPMLNEAVRLVSRARSAGIQRSREEGAVVCGTTLSPPVVDVAGFAA